MVPACWAFPLPLLCKGQGLISMFWVLGVSLDFTDGSWGQCPSPLPPPRYVLTAHLGWSSFSISEIFTKQTLRAGGLGFMLSLRIHSCLSFWFLL